MKIELNDLLGTNIQDLPGEVWEEVPGYYGKYLISQYSRVKSMIKKRPLILKRSISSGKYKVVLIGKYGRLVSEDIGRLCAKVFVRPAEENEVLEFKDGNRLNTVSINLRWITRKESRNKTLIRCRKSNILINAGESNGRAKINPIKASEIRQLKKDGKTYSQIAKKYNISIPLAQRVVENRIWKTA
ncbi:NUMOD4 domain-containing protein [Chryseobacterium sp. M5A1_1a]